MMMIGFAPEEDLMPLVSSTLPQAVGQLTCGRARGLLDGEPWAQTLISAYYVYLDNPGLLPRSWSRSVPARDIVP